MLAIQTAALFASMPMLIADEHRFIKIIPLKGLLLRFGLYAGQFGVHQPFHAVGSPAARVQVRSLFAGAVLRQMGAAYTWRRAALPGIGFGCWCKAGALLGILWKTVVRYAIIKPIADDYRRGKDEQNDRGRKDSIRCAVLPRRSSAACLEAGQP